MAKIVTIGKYYHPYRGGIELNSKDVCEELSQEHDISVFAFNHKRENSFEVINNVNVFRFSSQGPFFGQPVSFGVLRAILSEDADLFHLHAPNFLGVLALFVRKAVLRKRSKLVITHHMDIFGRKFIRQLLIPFYKYLASRADLVIVTSRKNYQISRDLPKDIKLAVIALGIRSEAYRPYRDHKPEARKWVMSITGGKPAIAFVGRHARYKGIDVLLRAANSVPLCNVVIGGDGRLRAASERLAKELGIAERVHFLGELTDHEKFTLLSGADIFAFPSTEITEAFGIVQLEAMAVGTPVIASRLPTGVTDVSVDRETALLCDPTDHEALAAAIELILSDKLLSDGLVLEAKRRVDTEFNLETLNTKTRIEINKVLNA